MAVVFLTRILLVSLTLLVLAEFVPGITVAGVYPAIVTAIILGLLNVVIRPILVILTLPITVLTLGLFIYIINAALFWFTATFIEGFTVAGFIPALLGSLVLTLVNLLSSRYITYPRHRGTNIDRRNIY